MYAPGLDLLLVQQAHALDEAAADAIASVRADEMARFEAWAHAWRLLARSGNETAFEALRSRIGAPHYAGDRFLPPVGRYAAFDVALVLAVGEELTADEAEPLLTPWAAAGPEAAALIDEIRARLGAPTPAAVSTLLRSLVPDSTFCPACQDHPVADGRLCAYCARDEGRLAA